MKKLNLLSAHPSSIDRYIYIRDSKHLNTRDALTARHPDIVSQYNNYQNAIAANTLHGLSSNANCRAIREELRACYDSSTKALQELKKAIKAAQPKRLLKYCPMCGTTLPKTFDHYLPASLFPEYSVFTANLVPCCSHCNSTKDNDWLTPAGKRQYLHAFVDQIPDADFLDVTLLYIDELEGVGAKFSLSRPDDLSDDQWGLLSSHYRKLRLIERYNELANDEVAEILSDCKIFLEEGGINVRSFLSAKARSFRGVHGRNYWRAVLMATLAADKNFKAWVAAA